MCPPHLILLCFIKCSTILNIKLGFKWIASGIAILHSCAILFMHILLSAHDKFHVYWPLTSIYCQGQECVEVYLHILNTPSWGGAQLEKHRENFTFTFTLTVPHCDSPCCRWRGRPTDMGAGICENFEWVAEIRQGVVLQIRCLVGVNNLNCKKYYKSPRPGRILNLWTR
jgi:hypothetical protein